MPVRCVLKMYIPFLITDGPFSRPAEWKLSSSWKICSPTGLTKRLTWQITQNWAVAVDPAVSLSTYSTLPMEVVPWPCGVRLRSPQGLASGGNSRGRWGLCGSTAGHGRQEHAARPALLWATGARIPEVEEALRSLDGHHTVTGARIVHIHISLYWKHIKFPFHIYILIFVVFSHPALIFLPLVFP